ncbi:MAG: GNAT family N-acetyltransferase, partial [Anaerolineae bacterium]|nr:GNAT family N-acetyltransferase [Anaerolineae bacterium]
MKNYSIALSELDQMRFGIVTAKAYGLTLDKLPDVDAFCREHHVSLLIARVQAEHLDAVQQMESDGYQLMDTLVYYAFKYARTAIPENDSPYVLRLAQQSDAERVAAVAAHSFQGYYGHYHADPNLDREACDATYMDWAVRSVTDPAMADDVLLVEHSDALLGFATLRMNNAEEGEGVLFGVAPEAQGRGIYKSMMIYGMQWSQERGAARMVVSTQLTNVAVQKVWARVGFEFDHAHYTFHKWF